MHASSMENMTRCFSRYIGQDFLKSHDNVKVLDIGGANVNGSYRDIIEDLPFEYLAADIQGGVGVDIFMEDPYRIPLEDSSIDIIISGQAFEHVEFFWKLFEEMSRVISDTGMIFLIAPSSGVIHRFPVDCYRFYPDSFFALGRYTKLNTLEVFHDQRGPWKDLVGVYSKKNYKALPVEKRIISHPTSERGLAKYQVELDASEELNKLSGDMPYLKFLDKVVHNYLKPRQYFEIGVRGGHSASVASCPTIGVDPAANLKVDTPQLQLHSMTSDEFFDEFAGSVKPIDLAFIDGMHIFEFALRDFINIEKLSHGCSVVLIDDIYPNNKEQASRERTTRTWMGDIWKLTLCFKQYRPDLICIPINTYPSGMLMIVGLDASNATLSDKYNEIVKFYSKPIDPNNNILQRFDSISPSHPMIKLMLESINKLRTENCELNNVKNVLKKIITKNLGLLSSLAQK